MKWRRKKNKYESIRPLEQRQAEKLAEIGSYLRQIRTEQALSLEEVAANTRIRLGLLQAIEEANLDELPEAVYTKSFIKQYAIELGLKGEELSNTFPTGDRLRLLKRSWSSLSGAQLRPIHLYLLYVFVIVCAVNGLSNILSRSELQVNGSQLQQKPEVKPAAKPEQILTKHPAKSEFFGTVPSNATEIAKPVRIGITLKAESWIRVVADGKPQFEGVLPSGTQRTWVAQQQLTVRAGNAGGVLVTFNQEKAKQLGNIGEVQEVTFAASPKI